MQVFADNYRIHKNILDLLQEQFTWEESKMDLGVFMLGQEN